MQLVSTRVKERNNTLDFWRFSSNSRITQKILFSSQITWLWHIYLDISEISSSQMGVREPPVREIFLNRFKISIH